LVCGRPAGEAHRFQHRSLSGARTWCPRRAQQTTGTLSRLTSVPSDVGSCRPASVSTPSSASAR
jgi:hypothetical protein